MGDMPADILQWYRQRVAELEEQVNKNKTKLSYATGLLGHFQQREEIDRWLANRPPDELVHALRSHTACPFQPVWVTIDELRLLVLADGPGHAPDEGAELTAWEWLQAHALPPVPAEGIARSVMPDLICGVGYPNQGIVLSRGLRGPRCRAAWRALRDGLHRQARAPGLRAMVALPLLASFRALRYLLTPTMGTATTATAVMPLVTAAAICHGSVTSSFIPDITAPGHEPRVIAVLPASDPLPVPGNGLESGRPDDREQDDGQAEPGEALPQPAPVPSGSPEPTTAPSPTPSVSPSAPSPSPSPSPETTPSSAPSAPSPTPSEPASAAPETTPAPSDSPTPQPAPEPEPTQPPADASPAPANPVPAPEAPAPSGDAEVPATPQAPEAPEEAPLTEDAATTPRPDEDPGPAPATPGAVAALS